MKRHYFLFLLVLLFGSTISVGQITVKFQKPDSWSEVSLYTWGPEVLGGWPGAALTEVDGWYVYTFESSFTTANLIFNNAGAGEQTEDYVITSDVCLQASNTLNGNNKYDVTVVPCTTAGFTVKFHKPDSWSAVSLYTWGPEAVGGWPGTALTEVDGWYVYTFDASVTTTNMIFNNAGAGEQTEDYLLAADVCLQASNTLNGNNKYDVTAVPCFTEGFTVKFHKPDSWTAVSLYTWGPEVTGGWPGTALTEVDGWFVYTFDASVLTTNLIFNNAGAGEQTEDYVLSSDVCLQSSNTLNGNNKYDVTVVPCATPGFIVKFHKPDSWTAVSLYTWGPEVLGGWPGATLTEVDGWFTYTFDASVTATNMIFNNAGAGEQTEDFLLGGDVCLQAANTLNGNNKYDVSVVPCIEGGIKVGFQKPATWTSVYVYAWYGPEPTPVTPAGPWPGTALTEENGFYSYTFDGSITEVNVIFNDNGAVQTVSALVTAQTCFTSDGASLTVIDCNLGINEIDGTSLTIYPNPVFDHISFSGFEEINTVSIYSITGEKVKTSHALSENGTLDVKSLKPGVYFVTVLLSNGRLEAGKIVKF